MLVDGQLRGYPLERKTRISWKWPSLFHRRSGVHIEAMRCIPWLLRHHNLYPNLSHESAGRAQTVQSEPNGVFSFQAFTSEPGRNHPFAKPLYSKEPPLESTRAVVRAVMLLPCY